MSNTPQGSAPPEDKGSAIVGDVKDQMIKGHSYDGIKEYDNPMPGWWVWIFWATIVFAAAYFVGINYLDVVDTYEEDLVDSQADLAAVREAWAEANPTFESDEASLAVFVGNESEIQAGAETYTLFCAACHGNEGQGLIGPNLADAYWIHGGSNTDIFDVISQGVPAQGMPAWEGSLRPEQRAQLVAFIRSLEGTEPAGAKEPQGELYEPPAEAAETPPAES